jgi:hypothetical protein
LAILEKAGQLTADECEDLQERAQESGVTIEDFIVTSGALPPHTLFHFLREQLSEKLLGSLFWEDGKWAWWEEETVEHDPFPVTLDATELLSRAVNEHAGSRYLKNFFQRRLTEPLVVLVEKNALSKTKLSPRAMRLYSNVKPGSNPDSVLRLFADRYSWSQADVFRTLYWLTERDILGFDGVDSPEFPAG